ncbi:hypothetical protein LSAT2_001461 [Lamellibrachia satsuma]|nr:hypothetical protein LSAT2_001461 [Lamellibrachia satsuma]
MRLLAVVVLACVVKQDLVLSQCTTRYCESELITGAQTTTVAPVGDVWTKGGNGEGAPCVFPFIYNGVEYNNCTFVNYTKR